MFDNLRDDAASSPLYEDEAKFQSAAGTISPEPARRSSGRFLGMTSLQRFVIALMLMIAVCVIGTMALFVLGKIAI